MKIFQGVHHCIYVTESYRVKDMARLEGILRELENRGIKTTTELSLS